MRLAFPGHTNVSDYRRNRDLDTAVARVRYRVGDVTFTRECFASFPDQVMVWRIVADQPGRVSFTATLDSPHPAAQTRARPGGQLALVGQVEEGGVRFEARMQIVSEGGQVTVRDDACQVEQADSALLLLAAATSFRDFTDIRAGPLERRPPAAVGQQVDGEHQPRDERLAGGGRESLRRHGAASRPDRGLRQRDHQIIRALFASTAEAARVLGRDAEFAAELDALRAEVAPNRIGRHGQLQEWLEDRDDPQNQRRHLSYLWACWTPVRPSRLTGTSALAPASPSGDSPLGRPIGRPPAARPTVTLASRLPFPGSSGQWPDDTGQWPVLPMNYEVPGPGSGLAVWIQDAAQASFEPVHHRRPPQKSAAKNPNEPHAAAHQLPPHDLCESPPQEVLDPPDAVACRGQKSRNKPWGQVTSHASTGPRSRERGGSGLAAS